jgi:hypothetical protein
MAAAEHLRRLRAAVDGPLTLGELSGRLGEDGFALLVVFLCLPFLQPVPLAGLSTAVGLYLAFAGVQHAGGRGVPWLPAWLAAKRLEERHVQGLLGLAERFFTLVEKVARPRLQPLARRHDLIGFVIAFLAALLCLPLPIPFSNMLCAVGMVLLALGHLEDDGLLAAGGLLGGLAAVAYHAALVAGAAALLASPASGAESELQRRLRAGDWNARVNAVHAAGEMGAEDRGLLRYAAEDADWQVRLTAAHFLGRAKAAPELGHILRHEPCRHVRLTALHWLGSMGSSGADVLREVLSGPWEAGSKQGCLSSPGSGRAPWVGKPAGTALAALEEGELVEEVVTRDPTALSTPTASPRPAPEPPPEPLPRRQVEELDSLLGPGFARTDPDGLSADYQLADSGKLKADTLPALLKLLKDLDPRKRGRAADELGKRGSAVAKEAVGPLTLALADKDRRVIASAALALGNMGAAADPAVPALARVLQKGPEDVESSAALALGRIGTPAAKKAFAKHAGSAAMELLRTPAVGR